VELLDSYPDLEDVMLDLLDPVGPTALVTPVDLVPPLIVVRRVGGFDNGITDFGMVTVQTYGATHEVARALAEACRQRVIAAPATQVAGVSIDDSNTNNAPVYADYGSRDIHHYIATYSIEFRRYR
jgi:hypothetical protein